MQATTPEFRFPKIDRRLLGTWKSDRRRTFRDWIFKPETSEKQRARFKALFGKLTVTYTRSFVTMEFQGQKTWCRYRVLGTDATSVVIASFDPTTGEPTLLHIHFEGDYYSIATQYMLQREFFRKRKKGGLTIELASIVSPFDYHSR